MKLNQQDINAINAYEFLEKLEEGSLPLRFKRELAKYEKDVVQQTAAVVLRQASYDTELDTLELERVVQAYNRPSLLIQNGEIQSSPSDHWREKLDAKADVLSELIPSVGRIELKNHERLDWVGTGFLIEGNMIVTNRHVAIEFFEKSGEVFTWRKNPYNMRTIHSRIDFIEEYDSPEELEYKIAYALYIANEDEPDLAILKLDSVPEYAIPLTLSNPEDDLNVLSVGYPWRDTRVSIRLQRIHESIFGDVYDVKRAAPGTITSISDSTFTHDCSLLNGNSGSPMIDIESGVVVGVHYGALGNKNLAVSSKHLSRVLNRL